jgi:hypothetical protein
LSLWLTFKMIGRVENLEICYVEWNGKIDEVLSKKSWFVSKFKSLLCNVKNSNRDVCDLLSVTRCSRAKKTFSITTDTEYKDYRSKFNWQFLLLPFNLR